MDELIVVTHPEPVLLEARPLQTEAAAEGNVALAYYMGDHLVARGFVAPEAVKAIHGILSNPVSVALAATEDGSGNIDARFCLVLPVDGDKFPLTQEGEEDGEHVEAWRESVPEVPTFSSDFTPHDIDDVADEDGDADDADDDDHPRVALLPIGNVVRNSRERHHPEDMARDLRDMLVNLIEGKANDAVSKAIDDLLNSL